MIKVPKSKPDVYMMRVNKGGLVPADSYTQSKLRDRGYKIGDMVAISIRKLNNHKFNGLIHRIGQLCAANIAAFSGMKAHAVLKRLQWEGNIACEEVPVIVSGDMVATMRFPMSMSFDSMDDGARHEMAMAMCNWISQKYWKTLSPEAIAEMAESFVDEV